MDRHYLYFILQKKERIVFFLRFWGSNLRYHRLSKFYWNDNGEKPNISSFDGRCKSFYKYTTKRGYWNSLRSIWKFLQSNPPIPAHYLREELTLIPKGYYFQFNGKQFTYKSTAPRWVQTLDFSLANIFMAYIETQSLSKIVFNPTVWKRNIRDIFFAVGHK